MKHVQITDTSGRGSVVVDGHDITGAVTAYTVHGEARPGPRQVELRLVTFEAEIDGEMVVKVPDDSCIDLTEWVR